MYNNVDYDDNDYEDYVESSIVYNKYNISLGINGLLQSFLEYKPNPYSSFPKTKNYSLNKFLSHFTKSQSIDYIQYGVDFFNIHNEVYLNILSYKTKRIESYTYKIIKDINTNTWFFTCKNLLILYINKKDYEEIVLLNQDSPFCFYVYKTDLPYYILICTSHTLSEIKKTMNKDIISFYVDNLVLPKYIILSEYINPFVILNTKHVDNFKYIKNKNFTFYNKIGSGTINENILKLICVIKHLYTIFNNYPKHHLNL
jgi:hypothetical protein